MPRKVLVVDDNEVNRRVLRRILTDDYEVLEAENGAVALETLRQNHAELSAVLLDIVMPVMDGYEVLRRMHEDKNLRPIPVIVTTGNTETDAEIRALSLGANDYVVKPYNPSIIRHRLQNTIDLRETSALINSIQRDELTGLYNREAFFAKATERVAAREAGAYVMTAIDIDGFKLFNDRFGTEEGTRVLIRAANTIREAMERVGGLACRLSADNFAVLYPSGDEQRRLMDELYNSRQLAAGAGASVTFSAGRYVASDPGLAASAMYDRAFIAKQSVKGRYDKHLAYFDESMRQKLLDRQEIVNDMNLALEREQFEVWYQPQYNHATGALVGAEALVRWRHPRRGMISPGEFIPLFERNGFVYELDKYVWERALRMQRKQLDEGRKPPPVSVNVSRRDILRDDLYDVVTALTQQYAVPLDLFRLEITESAFAENDGDVIAVVRRFVDAGYTVEIDDFGSGYSSLNTLKSVPASILKLDMRFLEGQDNMQRGGSILESIVRMAKWLGMPVIAEGVETRMQADYLSSIGCNYIQGYLYAKPMPQAQYEAQALLGYHEERMRTLETVEALDNNAFWDPRSIETLAFNSFVGGACIFELMNGKSELLRVNRKYAREIVGEGATAADALNVAIADYADSASLAALTQNTALAAASGEESTCDAAFTDLPARAGRTWLRFTTRRIAQAGDRKLMYSSVINVTAQREAESRLRDLNAELINLMNDTPGGFCRMRVNDDESLTLAFANRGFGELLGATNLERSFGSDALSHVHPDDLPELRAVLRDVLSSGSIRSAAYRLRTSRGEYALLRAYVRLSVSEDGGRYLNAYYIDPEKEDVSALATHETLSAIMAATSDIAYVKDTDLRYLYCSRAFADTAGLADARDVAGKTDFDLIKDRELAQSYRDLDRRALESGAAINDYVARLPSRDGVTRYANTSKYVLRDARGEVIGLYGVSRDITENRDTLARLQLLTDSIPCGLAMFEQADDRLVSTYLSDGVYRLIGQERGADDRVDVDAMLRFVYPEDQPALRARVDALLRRGAPVDSMFRIRALDGGMRWIYLRAALADMHLDRLTAHAALVDVTEQRAADEDRRMHEEEMRIAMSQMGRMICEYDPARRILNLPERYAAWYGEPHTMPHDMVVKTAEAAMDPDSLAAYLAFLADIGAGKRSGSVDVHARRLDGRWYWEHYDYVTIFNDEHQPVKAIISVEDTTAAREKEREQRETQRLYAREKELRRQLAADALAYYQLNLTTGILEEYQANAEGLQAFDAGREMTEESSRETILAIAPEDRERLGAAASRQSLLDAYRRGESSLSFTYRRALPGLGRRWVRAAVKLMARGENDVIAFIHVRDVDAEEKARLALNGSFDKEVDSVSLLDTKTGVARLLKTRPGVTAVPEGGTYDYIGYIRRAAAELVPPAERAAFNALLPMEMLMATLELEGGVDYAYNLLDGCGQLRRKRVRAFFLDDTRREIVLSRRDVTDQYEEQQRARLELQAATDAANAANRAKSDFLSRMSHDMRTPMNAIMGMVRLMREEKNPPAISEYLSDIDVSGSYLMGLIGDVLDLSRMEAGPIELHESVYTLEEFKRTLLAAVAPAMDRAGVRFAFDMACGASAIWVDKLRFNQIFVNLLLNAARFTEPGGRVDFWAEHIPDRGDKHGMRFFVRDNGRGMSPEFMKVMYDPFSQEENAPSGAGRGAGLGLAIVKRLVDAMDGNIRAVSRPGEGTTFEVELYARMLNVEGRGRAEGENRLSGLTLLVVDDNAVNVIVATRLLERKNCRVESAADGLKAVKMFVDSEPWHYDAVLMDLRMPVMDGLEAARHIRAMARDDAGRVPIIAMTAEALEDARRYTLLAGMDDYLVKPIDPDALYEAVERLVFRDTGQ